MHPNSNKEVPDPCQSKKRKPALRKPWGELEVCSAAWIPLGCDFVNMVFLELLGTKTRTITSLRQRETGAWLTPWKWNGKCYTLCGHPTALNQANGLKQALDIWKCFRHLLQWRYLLRRIIIISDLQYIWLMCIHIKHAQTLCILFLTITPWIFA